MTDKKPVEQVTTAVPTNAKATIFFGIIIVLLTFVGFGGWAATAPLSGGIIGAGTFVFEGRRQVVQHLEGGILRNVYVREGDYVEAGSRLFELDTTQTQSRVRRIERQLTSLRARAARLNAEILGQEDIRFPPDLISKSDDAEIFDLLERERINFVERQRSLDGQINLLQQRAIQLENQIVGLDIQEDANDEQIRLLRTEIEDIRPLLQQGLVQRPRVTALEREVARLQGINGDVSSQRAVARDGIIEASLEQEQIVQRFREEGIAELTETENRIADLQEELVAAEDVVSRSVIVAPQDGIAQNVKMTTIGAVVSPGEPLLEIAPTADRLILEVQVKPQDIDLVGIGQRAEARLSALNLRTTPVIFGEVISVSGDQLIEEASGAPFFLVQVTIPPEEQEKLGEQRLQAGMPAEVIFPTGDRTLVNYLVKPITDVMSLGLQEP